MKKYILFPLLVGLIPNVVFGASARYTQLVREKQRKMEQLEKCMGATKGLKIAGVSTLGLTAVGVAGNIYEAKVKNDTDKAIEKVDKKIEKTQQEIADKQAQKAEAEKKAKEEAAILAECIASAPEGDNSQKIKKVKKQGEQCVVLSCDTGFIPSGDKKTCVPNIKINDSTDFVNKCSELGGTYKNGRLEYDGESVKAIVYLYDGCQFTNSDNLRQKCTELESVKRQGTLFVDDDKYLCAFVGDTDFECLSSADNECWAKKGALQQQNGGNGNDGESGGQQGNQSSNQQGDLLNPDENISARNSECDNSVWSEKENYKGSVEKTDRSGTYTCNQNVCACYDINGNEFQPFMYDEQAKLFSVCCRDCPGFCATASVALRNN